MNQPALLLSAAELARLVAQPGRVNRAADGLVIVDCRFDLARPDAGEAAYRHGHIPGAHYAHLDRDLSSAKTAASGRHPLPQPQAFAALLSSWGVQADTRVVAYDDAGGAVAARLWWLLRWMGHEQAALLDGGLQAWQAAGLPITDELPPARAGNFVGRAGHMPTLETVELEQRLGSSELLLVDARAGARFRGESETVDTVAGHVPGAINLPFQDNLTTDGRFRPATELRAQFAAALEGRRPDEAVLMCGSGVTACHHLFALELAGMPGARLNPGSWSEWIRSPSRPVATGPNRGAS